jgi:L-iditol 2-dehydrogenase
VAVLGVGPIGLGVLLCLKAAGPCVAYATDLLPERLAAARHCGADAAFDARQDVVAELARREPQGLDCVFECSGDPACLDQGQRLLAPGGKLLMIGIPPDEQVLFDPHRARRAELTLQAVRRQRDCVVPTIRMIAQARLDPAPLVTHRFRLDEIRAALELAAAYRDGVIKAMLDLTGAW